MPSTSISVPDDDDTDRLARQAEQRRIAGMLHDSVSQSLTAAYWQATLLARKLKVNHSESAAEVDRLADRLHGVVLELQDVVRRLSPEAGLTPEPIPPTTDRPVG